MQQIADLSIATPSGELVPLRAVAKVELASGPEQINRRERERAITIRVTPPPTMPLEGAMSRIENEILAPMRAEGTLKAPFRVNLAGTADKLRATWNALRFNVLLALLITYLLMAALFESWLYPFVIIVSVPLGAVGGFVGLAVLNMFTFQSLDVLTMLGFVILIGTVVNNPILIVHQSLNHMREEHMESGPAVLKSVATRIRPIFMTLLTTVFGLLPLVVFPGAGSELYRGLGAILIGGLVISTLVTLLLVPTLFQLTMVARNALIAWLRRVTGASAEEAEVKPAEA
jgi:HAE1 family hydrophobic/amphiphilic exporter-1